MKEDHHMSFIDKQLYGHSLLNYKTYILLKFWIDIACHEKKNTILFTLYTVHCLNCLKFHPGR